MLIGCQKCLAASQNKFFIFYFFPFFIQKVEEPELFNNPTWAPPQLVPEKREITACSREWIISYLVLCKMQIPCPDTNLEKIIAYKQQQKDLCGGKGEGNPLSAMRITSLSTSRLSQIQNPKSVLVLSHTRQSLNSRIHVNVWLPLRQRLQYLRYSLIIYDLVSHPQDPTRPRKIGLLFFPENNVYCQPLFKIKTITSGQHLISVLDKIFKSDVLCVSW